MTVNVVDELVALRSEAMGCERCVLSQTRKQIVFGDGNINQPVVAFVGEAPGANEDEQGRPFCGRSGKKLDEWIEWMGLSRDRVYILNTLLCRPPENRNPKDDESDACRPFFDKQLELIKPFVIVALGKYASEALIKAQMPLKESRGRWWAYNGIPVRVTYHPSYILRNQRANKQVLRDLGEVRVRVEELLVLRNNGVCGRGSE